MDLGACPKIHDFALRADYENASKERDYYYDCEVSIMFKVNSEPILGKVFKKLNWGKQLLLCIATEIFWKMEKIQF